MGARAHSYRCEFHELRSCRALMKNYALEPEFNYRGYTGGNLSHLIWVENVLKATLW